MNRQLVEQCVERLCGKGCRAVWADIDALEAEVALPEVEGLSRPEIAAVVAELRSIMAVYAGSCPPEPAAGAEGARHAPPTRPRRGTGGASSPSR